MKNYFYYYLNIFLVSALLTLFTGNLVNGQDVIVKKNGDEIKAKVEQVLDKEIMYRRFDNLGGPVYSVAKAEVSAINYENSTKDVFETQPTPAYKPPVTSQPKIAKVNTGPAVAGAIINYALIAPVTLCGLLSAFGETDDQQITFGVSATVLFALGAPTGTILSGITRRAADIDGSLGSRITGWIFYGLAMAEAIGTITLQEELDLEPFVPVIGFVVLGSISTALFGIDASRTIREAKDVKRSFSLKPTINIGRDRTGNQYSTVGVVLYF
jgi:hypothetical protein